MTSPIPPELAEATVKPIIEWLSAVHGKAASENIAILRSHQRALHDAGLPPLRHLQLLDFLFDHSFKVVDAFLPELHAISLPAHRKLRHKIRGLQELLENFATDYLALFEELQADVPEKPARQEEATIWRAVCCLRAHLLISYLVTSPPGVGIWQTLHIAYLKACQHDLESHRIPRQELTLEQLYLTALLLHCAQPASFSSQELEFIADYVSRGADLVALTDTVPTDRRALFWVDQTRDLPAQPLSRRLPPPEAAVLYFACDELAALALDHLQRLEDGYPAYQLDLPAFADSAAGKGVLRRLAMRWGTPPKRRFPRRHQSYRVTLCAGMEDIWQLLHQQASLPEASFSEWMITNESPDGCAMMHVNGATEHLHVGDLVAIRQDPRDDAPPPPWIVCIVRWALSDNPEHIELGLQILSPAAQPALLALAHDSEDLPPQASALLLPELPPLRPDESVIVPTGMLTRRTEKFSLLLDQEKIHLREMHTTSIREQTERVEVFSVAPNEKP